MSLWLRSSRQRRLAYAPDREDVRWDLAATALDGFLYQVMLSGFCMVSATALTAQHYRDRWLWTAVEAGLTISVLRAGAVYGFTAELKKGKDRNFEFWAVSLGVLSFLFCALMSLLNIYNFRVHDLAAQALCVMGTCTLCVGISSRLSLVPRASQASIVLLQGSLAYMLLLSLNPLVRCAATLAVVSALTVCASIGNQHKVFVEQVRTRRQLKNLATHDTLTGLPNRHLFESTIEQVCAARRPFALWMLDLDSFKAANDTYGHGAGDELLRAVGKRLEQGARSGDLVARLGGDEFVILQWYAGPVMNTKKMAERIRKEISAPYQIDGQKVTIGISIGILLAEGGSFTWQAALKRADEALYRAKDRAKGSYEIEEWSGQEEQPGKRSTDDGDLGALAQADDDPGRLAGNCQDAA